MLGLAAEEKKFCSQVVELHAEISNNMVFTKALVAVIVEIGAVKVSVSNMLSVLFQAQAHRVYPEKDTNAQHKQLVSANHREIIATEASATKNKIFRRAT